jgi:hypothetical protein
VTYTDKPHCWDSEVQEATRGWKCNLYGDKKCILNFWHRNFLEGHQLEDKGDFKMGLREMGCEDGRWMELAQGRVSMGDFGICCVETPSSATRELVN